MKNIIFCTICLASCFSDDDNDDNKSTNINISHRSEYKSFELDTECVRFFYMFWRDTIQKLTDVDTLIRYSSNYNVIKLKSIDNIKKDDWEEINNCYTNEINRRYIRESDFDKDIEWCKIVKKELQYKNLSDYLKDKNKDVNDYLKDKNKDVNIKHVNKIENFYDLYCVSIEFKNYLYSHFEQGEKVYKKKREQENMQIKKEHYQYAYDICHNLKEQLKEWKLKKCELKKNEQYMIELYDFFDQISRLQFIFKETELRRGKDENGDLNNLNMLNI